MATGDGALPDPLLQTAYDTIADKPRHVQTLLLTIGSTLWTPLVDRLVDRGLLRRERRRFLGFIPTTRLPAAAPNPNRGRSTSRLLGPRRTRQHE